MSTNELHDHAKWRPGPLETGSGTGQVRCAVIVARREVREARPVGLRLVHRDIDLAEQFLQRRLLVGSCSGDTDAGLDPNFGSTEEKRCSEGLGDPLGHLVAARRTSVGKQHGTVALSDQREARQ